MMMMDDTEQAFSGHLFRRDSDSDAEDEVDDDSNNNDDEKDDHDDEVKGRPGETTVDGGDEGKRPTLRRHQVLQVILEEWEEGGSIAHRLWPAAQVLAQFITQWASEAARKRIAAVTENTTHTTTRSSSAADTFSSSSAGQFTSDNNGINNKNDLEDILAQLGLDQLFLPPLPVVGGDDHHPGRIPGLGPVDHQNNHPLCILELGAGVGLTGLELAIQLPANVLLTDLDTALPLLRRNVQLNQEQFRLGPGAVQVQRLAWGTSGDLRPGLPGSSPAVAWQWFQSVQKDPTDPLMIVASDCVYWEELHEPLEWTLAHLLSAAPTGSVAFLAGQRRWKRDTAFFQRLGQKTRTATHALQGTCLEEQIQRHGQERQVMRIYAVQWLPRRDRIRRPALRGPTEPDSSNVLT